MRKYTKHNRQHCVHLKSFQKTLKVFISIIHPTPLKQKLISKKIYARILRLKLKITLGEDHE